MTRSLLLVVVGSVDAGASARKVTVKVLVVAAAVEAMRFDGAVVSAAVGATVSTLKEVRLALAATLLPATSLTELATRLTVYVPCALLPQLLPGAVMV